MKVEQQIKWEERLWCMHAWGSRNEINSGTYSYICNFYKIPFEAYSFNSTFEAVCKRALDAIKLLEPVEKAFDFMLIDESQDFPKSFFELCDYVTKKNIYIAGDIFQSIFDEAPSHSIEPDYLLNKCYRTDPRTLMFAHALGMGLFEEKKLRWLEDQEWNSCGYNIQKFDNQNGLYRLSREPLRRFEDVDRNELNSVELLKIKGRYYENVSAEIYSVIRKIIQENPTVCPDDIGIIMMDKVNQTYALADELEQMIPRIAPGWSVNKAHETKRNRKGELFVSNRNNVKGLEFPFVICVTKQIQDSYGYRNALYMTLTRSFLQTYLLISDEFNHECFESIGSGLDKINKFGYIEAIQPSESEKETIRTTIKHSRETLSHFDFVTNIFDDLHISPIFREALFETVKKVVGEDFDYVEVREVIEFNYKIMLRGSGNK
jgi:superfamily I DNA and RNA helicase